MIHNTEDKKILDNAPEGATHYAQGMHYISLNKEGVWMRYDPNGLGNCKWFNADDYKFGYVKDFRSLADIKRIAELEMSISMLVTALDEPYHPFRDYIHSLKMTRQDVLKKVKGEKI